MGSIISSQTGRGGGAARELGASTTRVEDNDKKRVVQLLLPCGDAAESMSLEGVVTTITLLTACLLLEQFWNKIRHGVEWVWFESYRLGRLLF